MNASPGGAFYPISGARAFEEVVEQLTFRIRSGAFAIGEKLPSIEELANAMEVSRPTVGHALKVLGDAGLVRVQRGQGGGSHVLSNSPPTEPLADIGPLRHFSFVEVLELRRPIETEIALLASRRGSKRDFEDLSRCIQLMRESIGCETVRVYHDHRFHYVLGRMARNGALALHQHQILERVYFEMARTTFFEEAESVAGVLKWHTDTLEALLRGDEREIRTIVAEHLRPLEEYARSRT